MSLTSTDLQLIQGIVYEAIHGAVPDMLERSVSPLRGEIKALRNDVKEIYKMLNKHERRINRVNTRVDKLESGVFPARG